MFPHNHFLARILLLVDQKKENENINLSDSRLLHGFIQPCKYGLALLIAKFFIYQLNLAEGPLLFSLFSLQFRENVMIEPYIPIKNKLSNVLTTNGTHLC